MFYNSPRGPRDPGEEFCEADKNELLIYAEKLSVGSLNLAT